MVGGALTTAKRLERSTAVMWPHTYCVGQETAAIDKRCFFRPDGDGAVRKFRQCGFHTGLRITLRGTSRTFPCGLFHYYCGILCAVLVGLDYDVYFWFDIVLNCTAHHDGVTGELVVDQKGLRITDGLVCR